MSPLPRSLKAQLGNAQSHVLSTGLACESPFHVPEAAGVMIFGTYELRACRERLATARYRPVACLDGRALGCLWISDFGDSTCGPYQELTVTILVSESSLAVPWVNRWTPFAVQQLPGVFVCEYVLVLNNRHAVAYGRELHGFDKHLGELHYGDHGGAIDWRVSQDTVPTVSGHLRVQAGLTTQARMLAQIGSAMGLVRTARALREKLHPLRVVTPPRIEERRTDLFFRGRPLLQPWGRRDALHVGESPVGRLITSLGFSPTAVQILRNAEGIMPLAVPDEDAR